LSEVASQAQRNEILGFSLEVYIDRARISIGVTVSKIAIERVGV